MSSDLTGLSSRKPPVPVPVDADIGDSDLLDFALGFAGPRPKPRTAIDLINEFGGVDLVLASEPDDLRERGLSDRAVAILKLLHAFRHDSRRRTLLH